jgi:hypothetical protein
MKNKFLALFIVTNTFFAAHMYAQDPHWVRDHTWFFDNFKKDTLPWTYFRETFIGVAPEPAGDFDIIFYNELYRTKLAGPGHCYGMDVMAMLMMKNGGCLGYCDPPYVYSGVIGNTAPDSIGPTDPNLRTAISIAHGNQINHGFLSFLLDVIAIGKNRDGRFAAQQVDYYLAKGDPPVISVTKNLSPADGGHVLIPFFVQDPNPSTRRIYVYDPNRSYYATGADGKDYYEGLNNFIEINNSTGAWTYTMKGPEVWSGSPSSGGNCLVIPLSVAGKKDRLPQSLLAVGAYALNSIFIFGDDVQLRQISDAENGRHLFEKSGGTNWETSEHRRLKNVLPFIPMGGETSSSDKSSVYFVRGNRKMDVEICARGTYRIGMLFAGKYREFKGYGDGKTMHFFTPGVSKPHAVNKKKSVSHSKLVNDRRL